MSAKLKRNALWALLSLLLLMNLGYGFVFQALRVTPSVTTTNTTAAYTVYYDRTNTTSLTSTNFTAFPLNTTSTVTLNFPLQYSLTNNITCNYQINSTGAYFPATCNLVGNQITLNGLFANGTVLATLTLLITNVINPYPAGRTSNFTGSIGIDTSGASGANSFVTITAASSVCSFTFNPNIVYSTANMIFTLTINNQFPSGGTIGVQFSNTRLWSQQLDSTRLMPISTSMACGNESANVNSGIQCTGSTSFAVVTFSSIVTNTLSPGTTLSFSIINFISPPTGQAADTIAVTTYMGSSSIDTCNARVVGLQPMIIPSTQFQITQVNNLPMVVNQQYTIKFYIKTISIISLSDAIVITLPAGTSISNFVPSALGGTVSFDSTTSAYYNQVLTLYLDGGPGTLDAGGYFITVPNFVAPPNTHITNNFQISITSNTFPRMVSTQTMQAVTNTLTGTATMGVTTVNAISSYTFSITIPDPITSGGFMVLTFPSILGLSNSSTATISSGTSMNANPTCVYSSAGNSLTITSLNSSTSNIPAQTFNLVISGITNPPSTTTTGPFTLTTYFNSSTAAMVDAGSISGVTATPAAIDHTKISVMSSSSITSDTTVTYYFSFMVQNPIPIGGFVIVNFPTTIVFDLSTANNNCQLTINSSAATSTPCTASLATNYIFNFTNPFPSSPITPGTNLTFSILSAATNPPTTQPISPFSVFTYYSDGFSIASAANVSSFSGITTPSTFASNTISKVSNKNGEYTSFTVTVAQIANLEASATILVVFPWSLQPQSSSQCSITYIGATTIAACGFTSTTNTFKVISIGSIIAGGTSFSITFTNVRNALSFASIFGFQVTTKTAMNLYFYSSSASTNNISNTIPTQFSSLDYQYSPQQLNTAMSLKVNFQLSQYTLMPTSLQISLDSYFTATNLTCNAFVDFVATCSYVTSNTLRISGSFNNSVMSFTISGFSSPATPPSTTTYSTLGSFDVTGAKIDESTNNITFSLGCALPCQTCNTGNTSSCITCYNSTAITTSIYYYGPNNYCYTNCPATTYNNVNLICTPCDSNCFTCKDSATFCLKCKPNSTYPFLNITNSSQFCVAGCTSGMYGSTSVDPPTCVSCVSPCSTCTSSTICVTCLPGFYFLNGTTCVSNCTPLVTIQNNSTRICDPCNSICLYCVGTINTCTACNDPLVFYNGSCQTGCPSGGTLAPSNGVCTPCISTCQTCNITIYNCITCRLNSSYPYLVNGSCLTACPVYFYNDSSTGSCYSCAASNQNCINCSSAATCLSCDTSFVLYNSKCINYVPSGYVNISGIAVACTGDCKTCSVTAGNCTSCKNLSLQGYSCVNSSSCSAGTISVVQFCVTCNSPCLTCAITQDNCTSCIPNATQPLFLSNYKCQSICPPYFYPNSLSYVCSPCINNCSLCSSTTICNSCLNNTYLFNTTCMVTCPSGYVGINSFCQSCTSNCRTCAGGANICLTCISGTYFINSTQSCVNNCPTGLFLDSVSQSCVGCSSSCLTCSGSASACTACNNTLLLNSQCVPTCPSGMFAQAGTCSACPTNCSSCTNLVNCTGCTGANYLYNGQCLSSCPSTSGRIVNGVCVACSTQNCYSCTSSNVCLSCNSNFLFLNAICLGTCPNGYNSNGTHCVSILDQTLTSSFSSPNNSFPVPFTIAGIVLIIACLMSRLQFPQTYLSGAIYSLIGILEWCALWYFLYLYFIQYMSEPVAEFIGLGAMGFLYIMNITAWLAQTCFLCYEKDFITWTGESKCHKCFYYFTTFISLVANHKFKNILFCKLFTFKVFSARLDRVQHFRIFNIFSLISLVHSGGAIFAAGIALTKTNSKEQLFHECIDVIVLSGLNVVLAFFNTHKDKDFFEETTPDGYSLHKKNNLMEQHLVGSKAHGLGQDGQVEEGYINQYNHALTSKQALKFGKDQSVGARFSDSSLADLTEKQQEFSLSQKSYEEVSVQALDLLDTRTDKHNITAKTNAVPPVKPTYEEISIQADSLIHEQQQRGVDFSALPPQGFDQDNSSFTTYFQKVDRSVQGNLDRGVNFSAQVGAHLEDKSMQNNGRLGDAVDYSVQKSESFRRVDQSMQYSRGKPKDASLQYSRNQIDESVNASHHSRSFGVQQYPTISDKGVGGHASLRSQGNQISEISQEDEQIQFQPENQDVGIQPTIQFEDVAIQPDIDYEDVAIQPDLEYNQVAVQPSLQPSANQMAIQYEPIQRVNYDELEEELHQSNTASNVLFETEEFQQQEKQERHLAEQQVEKLQLRNEDMRSYQEQLEERIRNKEKELQQFKRKVDFKQRSNAAKKEQLAESKIQEQDIDLQGVTYIQQRPAVSPQRVHTRQAQPDRLSSSNSSHQLVEEIQVRRQPQSIQLGIQSKQIPKEVPRQLNASQSSASNPLNETLEQIKVFKEPNQVAIVNQPQKASFKKQPSERPQPSQRLPNKEVSQRLQPYKDSSDRSPSQKSPSQKLPYNKQPSAKASSFNESDRLPAFREPSQKPYSVSRRDNTIEEYKVEEAPVRDRAENKRQNTIEEIRLQEVRPTRAAIDAIETRSDFARTKPAAQKKQIQYKEYDNELLSEDSEEQKNVFIRSNDYPTPKRNDKSKQQQQQQPVQQKEQIKKPEAMPRNIEVRDMGNMELETGSQPDYEVSNLSSSHHHQNNQLEDRQHPQINFGRQDNFDYRREQEAYREDARSHTNRQSQATRKNYYAPNRKNVVIDVTQIDQSLRGEEDYAELEQASQSDHEPAGIVNAYQAKPNFNQHQRSRSDLSGTIEEIPQHQLAFDDQKTISNPDVPQRPPRPQVSQQQITNIFAGSLPVNQKGKKNNMPADQEPEQFRINRLYANDNTTNNPIYPQTSRNQEAMPRNVLQRERKSTLAQAGRAQLAQDKLAQKKSTGKSPLKVAARQWQAQHEDKYISEEEEFAPASNRNNLVRRPVQPHQNFASHLVLPQETDKQDTSFQHPKRDIISGKQDTSFQYHKREAPMSGKMREPSRQPEEIEVHFEADQLSRDLSGNDKNRSPQMPRAYGRQPSRQQSSLLEQEESEVDYRQMMMLGQMQERPRNGDLQDYYRKQSKDKRRKSNSKLDRSTEKIYMQKLDKKR